MGSLDDAVGKTGSRGQHASAISGNRGHDATFAVALALCHGFALSKERALPIMRKFNARCEPRWSQKELDHKLDDAAKVTRHAHLRGYLLAEREESSQVEPSITVLEVDTSEPLPGERRRKSSESVPNVPEQLTPERLVEARRIAGELVKLRDAGAISGPDDREAIFFAHFLHAFEAEFIERRDSKNAKTDL